MRTAVRAAILVASLSHAAFGEPPPPPVSPDLAAQEIAAITEQARRPLGWLSDPDAKPESFFEALVTGKISLNDRLRLELADTTGRDSSLALTNRLRLGYETKPFHGLSALVEMENVLTPTEDEYYVPQTGNGSPNRTVIADPPGTEVNQAFGRFATSTLGESGVSLDLKGGRQRIALDDERFIGAVGWRQFEQTFDAASVRSDLGVEGLSVFYAYLWRVQRIFGPDGPNPDSSSHLVNLSYGVLPQLRISPFAYLLDFEQDDPTNSVNSYGVRLTGDLWRSADDSAPLAIDYEFTWAWQEDAGSNPIDLGATFIAAQVRLASSGLGALFGGYQLLGSDDGRFGFRFPLGTNHAFQGFADNFLVTPAVGLQDLYFGLNADLPWAIKGLVVYHQFWSDEGGTNFGNEVDLVASRAITPNWSVLVKAAFYDGGGGQPDTTRFWVQTEVKF